MEQATLTFLENGLLGAVIVVLAGVGVYMQKKLDTKSNENYKLHRELVETQERWRLSETERADRLMETVNTASAVQSALVDKIEIGRGK